MRISLRNSIQTRLLLITFGMISFVLIIQSFLSVYRDYRQYNYEVRASMGRVASLVGDNSLASLLFDDPDSAKDILATLNSQDNIVAAWLLTDSNKVFANYVKPGEHAEISNLQAFIQNTSQSSNQSVPSLFIMHDSYAFYVKLIFYEKKVAGKILLVYDMAEREEALIQSVQIALIVLAISLLLVLIMVFFLQRAIIKPISLMADTMYDWARESGSAKEYHGTIKDEVTWLLSGFKEMLTQLNITEGELKQKNQDLRHLAYHDALTELPNFLLFKKVVANAIQRGQVEKFCILFIDLDNFKHINDSFGHNIGDAYLKEVSNSFNNILRIGDFASMNPSSETERSVARMGGDEFIVMLNDIKATHNIDRVLQRIFKYFEKPLNIEGIDLYVKLSIGISVYPDDATDIDRLIKYADTAMYQVKHSGRNNYGYFNKAHHEVVKRKLLLEKEMLCAIERNQFELYYQPKIDIKNKSISGFEVLIRWQHPELGFISPAEFIPIAEMCRFIIPLGEWIVQGACAKLSQWRKSLNIDFDLAINLSPVQFKSDSLFDCVKNEFLQHQLSFGSIEFEITEGILMNDHEYSFQAIDKLRKIGVKFSIDDFGTGYSSFQYLGKFNADFIKIDKTFIDNIDHLEENQIISNSIISLAHNMGMKVVAEGVETIEQLDYLKEHGCDIIQGYYFSKPLPTDEVEPFIKTFYKDHL